MIRERYQLGYFRKEFTQLCQCPPAASEARHISHNEFRITVQVLALMIPSISNGAHFVISTMICRKKKTLKYSRKKDSIKFL